MALPSQKKIFQKPTLPLTTLITRLQDRGMSIPDAKAADNALNFIGYYRLRGYLYPFYFKRDPADKVPAEPKCFVSETTFDDVIALYDFDRKLRLHILEQIQKVEIGLRTCLSEHMSSQYGPHWFMNLSVLSPAYEYEKFFAQIKGAKETFIEHYRQHYETPRYPPSWMITETLSFGAWSKMYKVLLPRDQKAIAQKFNVKSYEVMGSWFHTLSHLRNLCAHHNRVWNRTFMAFPPAKAKGLEQHMQNPHTLYSRLVVLKYLSDQVTYDEEVKTQLQLLMKHSPGCVEWGMMGFVEGWEQTALWQNSVP